MSVKWIIKHHSDLEKGELYKILQLRNAVYIVELKCPVAEIDGEDLAGDTYHLMGFDDKQNELVAYLRIHKVGNNEMKIRRVVVAKDFRGRGLAREMMLESFKWSKSEHISKLNLAARIHLQKFYESLGFIPVSDPYYLEPVGVWHVDMVRDLV